MRIDTEIENTFNNCVESDVLIKKILLLPLDCDKNCLLITKRPQSMQNIICYSLGKIIINSM